jgi:hypothetical protein
MKSIQDRGKNPKGSTCRDNLQSNLLFPAIRDFLFFFVPGCQNGQIHCHDFNAKKLSHSSEPEVCL